MRKKESEFNTLFRRELEKLGFTFYRFESHAVSPGAPDNHYIRNGQTGWVEVKQEHYLVSTINYRRNQPLWLMSYAERGGSAWTVLHLTNLNAVIMVPGEFSVKATQDLFSTPRLLVHLDHPDAWKKIAQELISDWGDWGSLRAGEWLGRDLSDRKTGRKTDIVSR